mmetsp:Transcript_24493/g.66849  ORF Transcript_24493/g.66849 Transcript_24493/m.66849 type:complete len:319 (-) Transcript_24493:492-1448(-)
MLASSWKASGTALNPRRGGLVSSPGVAARLAASLRAMATSQQVSVAQDGSTQSSAFPTHKLSHSTHAKQPSRPVVLVGCGSYNPPTVMHMRMFELANDELLKQGYDVWGGYMSPVSDAYGKASLVPAVHRLSMCEAAARSCPLTMLDPWEACQPTYTPTLQVLRRVREQLQGWLAQGHRPSNWPKDSLSQQAAANDYRESTPQAEPNPQVMLLCGADVLASFTIPGVWEDPDTLLREHGVACIVREGTDMDALLQHELLKRHQDNIVIVPEPVPNFLSSTLVRKLVAEGRSVRYLVPNEVVDYLAKHAGVYRLMSSYK